jgi:hypothetical protein
MWHLSEEEFIDVAEDARLEEAVPHLAGCEKCREQLAALRAVMRAAEDVAEDDIPEPSPLFWEHLSARVRERVAHEPLPRAATRPGWASLRWLVPAGAAALVLVLSWSGPSPEEPTVAPGAGQPAAGELALSGDRVPFAANDDASLTLLADLTSELEWDGAVEAGLAPMPGTIDRVVDLLDDIDRATLHGLLQEELSRPGA